MVDQEKWLLQEPTETPEGSSATLDTLRFGMFPPKTNSPLSGL